MATSRPCEAEVYVDILGDGTFVLFPNLLNFGVTASASTESTPVLGNNCINKASTSSKELTGSAEYCWDCEEPSHIAIRCDGTYDFEYYPKGQGFVSPNGNPTPLFKGEMTLSGAEFTSTASENIQNIPIDFGVSRVDSSNIIIQ